MPGAAHFSSASAFDPKALGTLLLWYDATQQGGTDGAATQLTDKSGNGNHAVPAAGSGGVSPTFRTGGWPANGALPRWEFGAAGHALATQSAVALTTFTLLVVASPTANGMFFAQPDYSESYWYTGYAGAAAYTAQMNRSGGLLRRNDSVDWAVGVTGVFALQFTAPTFAGLNVYRSSKTARTLADTADTMGAVNSRTAVLTILQGGTGAGSFQIPGSLGELLLYSPALATADLNTALDALGAKWAVTIAP